MLDFIIAQNRTLVKFEGNFLKNVRECAKKNPHYKKSNVSIIF